MRGKTWLFLDYDGTLAEFAPTPDLVSPDADLIKLISRLSRHREAVRIVILSGRKICQIQELVPVPGVLLAGTYGIEFQASSNSRNANGRSSFTVFDARGCPL